MASKKSVPVRILDQNFNITTDASPERVKKIADFLTKNLSSVTSKSKNLSPYNAAILAALNITEKYFDAIEKQNELKITVSERSKKILSLLETSDSNASADAEA